MCLVLEHLSCVTDGQSPTLRCTVDRLERNVLPYALETKDMSPYLHLSTFDLGSGTQKDVASYFSR